MLRKMRNELFEIIEEKDLVVKRFFQNFKYICRNIIRYTPLILTTKPWDYRYGLNLFVTFLEDLSEYSREYDTQYYVSEYNTKYVHEQIDEWIKLYNIVYDETEPFWDDLLIEKYGNYKKIYTPDGYVRKWDKEYTEEELKEIEQEKERLIHFCMKRDKENFDKLWDNFKNQHRNWWN